MAATATAAGEQLVTAADQAAEVGPEAAEVLAGGIKEAGATIGEQWWGGGGALVKSRV